MSNVLIGIIGVIFFIGLALAGASYIGPLVTDGTTQRNTAQIVMSGQQTAAAAKLYNMRSRTWVPNSLSAVDTMISAGILKSRPINPIVPANYPLVIGPAGGISPNDTGRPSFVLLYLGQSEQARDACIEIEIQNGHSERSDPTIMEQTIGFFSHATTGKPGCHRNAGAFGANGGAVGDYVAFFPI